MRTSIVACLFLALVAGPARGQADARLLKRWVGTHDGAPLHLDFYGDSMLVVNDEHAVDYRATRDSIIVTGDTSFTAVYWFALDRLLLSTDGGDVVTLSPQEPLARPLEGRWRGHPSGWTEREVELVMGRGGTARWRRLPGGNWVYGDWERETRFIDFTWQPDSTLWAGQYDPTGNALLFEEAIPGTGTLVLRRVFR